LSAAVNSAVTNEDMSFNLKGRSALTELADKYGDSFISMSNKELYKEANEILNPIVIPIGGLDKETAESLIEKIISLPNENTQT